MKDYGLVSIITPAYNSASFISETIESIMAQTYTNWELLITDDSSTDRTREVVEEYARKDNRIHYFRLAENEGPGAARNNSIEAAKGRFIAFCDSDDRWEPTKLEEQLKFMTDNGYHFTYTSYRECSSTGTINGYVECPVKIKRFNIIQDDCIGCLTAIYDTEKTGKCYMPLIRRRQDWCLWIDIIAKYGPAYGLRKPLSIYRQRNLSVSSNKIKLLKYNFNVYHKYLGYNGLKSGFILTALFLPHYFYKKIRQKIEFQLKKKQYV